MKMLQTRIPVPQRPRALTMISFCAILCLLAGPVRTQKPEPSCTNVVNLVGASGQSQVSMNDIYESLKEETIVGGVCKLDKTCCSLSAEVSFRTMSTGNYKQKIQTLLANTLMPCHNHTFLGEFVSFIRDSKVNLVSVMKRQFLHYFNPYVTIFDEFYTYLETGVWTGNLCDIEQKFTKVSFELFLAAYVVSASVNGAGGLPNTDEFRSCFYDYFLDLRGDTVYNQLNGFLRAYNLTMRYTRALKMVESVIEGILDLPLTEQCQNALMKMTYCSQCAGYSDSLQPCQGLCMNSFRGCLLDFADLVVPIKEVTEALGNMNKLLEIHNPWVQITLLNPYFLTTVTQTRLNFDDIRENLFLQCNSNGPINRQRRSASRESSTNVRDRRLITERAAPLAPLTAMNGSIYCLAGSLPLFTTMAEDMCSRGGINGANQHCWNGQKNGSYENPVIDLERSAQRSNPEVVVCAKQSRLRKPIAQLRFITNELNILSESQGCGLDDEDCLDSVPNTCDYYQFPDKYEYVNPNVSDVIADSSGSGSGDNSERGADEEERACAEGEGTEEEPEVTPTIIIGPDTTDMDVTEFGGNNTDRVGSGAGRSSSSTLLTLVLVATCLFWVYLDSSRH